MKLLSIAIITVHPAFYLIVAVFLKVLSESVENKMYDKTKRL